MKPIEFTGSNAVFESDSPDILPLPALVAGTETAEVVTCWSLDADELKRVNETGVVWICVTTFGRPVQPIFVTTNRDDLFEIDEPETESES